MTMDKLELQKLRELPIEGVAERLGLQVTRHKCLCPFHDDHHASLSFSVSRNTYRCFVCGASGGTIDLVMQYLNLGFKEACSWLNGGELSTVAASRHCEDVAEPVEVRSNLELNWQSTFNASRYERYFQHPQLSEAARRFLFEERKLDERVVRWCRLSSLHDQLSTEFHMFPDRDEPGERLFMQLKEVLPGLVHHQLPPGCKDFSDFYLTTRRKEDSHGN